ncbi:MAG: hypothetical protein ACK5FT_02085 [Sphingomonadales bacterium]|jgi:hypothetical protein
MEETFETIRDRQLACGHIFFDNSVNLIAIRKDNFFDNGFTDILCVAYRDYDYSAFDPKKNRLLTIPWTTLAGSLGPGGILHPRKASGLNTQTLKWESLIGTAILKAGQYLRAYQFIDDYRGWLKYPYFRQVAPVEIYRDGTRDLYFSHKENLTTQRGLFGINLHRMSALGQQSTRINTSSSVWSEGCQGAPEPEFKKLIPIIREEVKRFGPLFSYTILENL